MPHGLGRPLSNTISIPQRDTKVNAMTNLLKSVIAPKIHPQGRQKPTVDRGLTAVAEKRAKDAKWVSEDEVAKEPQR